MIDFYYFMLSLLPFTGVIWYSRILDKEVFLVKRFIKGHPANENIFYKQREDFLKTLPERDKKFTFPDDVEEIKNVPYASDGLPAHRLDIYRPRKAGGQKLPVIVNVHGGGLIIGCKEFNRYFCANLCKKGYLVFSVEYRLVPDCLFFDQCRDVFAAMDFIGEHLAEYSGLPDRILR